MTAHTRALPRLYDELNSSHLTVHGSSDSAIAAGFVMVNIAESFLSPDLNKQDIKKSRNVSKHKQPADAESVVRKVEQRPRRTTAGQNGFDAMAIVVIDCKNDGSPVRLVNTPPSPPLGGTLQYEMMIRRIAHTYEARFANI